MFWSLELLFESLWLVLTLLLSDLLATLFPTWHKQWLQNLNAKRRYPLYRESGTPDNALIVVAHPAPNVTSLSSRTAAKWEELLAAQGIPFTRVDLSRMGLTGLRDEWMYRYSKYGKGEPSGEIKWLQEELHKARFVILVHPVFWYDVPATLKAFLDQVMTAGFAYKNLPLHPILVFTLNICQFIPGLRGFLRAYGSQGLLRDKKVVICRTTGGPKAGMRVYGHNETVVASAFRFCGAKVLGIETLDMADTGDFLKSKMAKVEGIKMEMAPKDSLSSMSTRSPTCTPTQDQSPAASTVNVPTSPSLSPTRRPSAVAAQRRVDARLARYDKRIERYVRRMKRIAEREASVKGDGALSGG
ncbi:unnamed protein product [Vitrella brassicaformis CCMP3155]|uniref:Flavodoxin-like fold domain-containing protein n=1 Tax=Vitrella brassicaformis (strain CCMP3155) TaxID=1169540 RepID=A0A0G4FDQ0_VITBC|nr:unnamed protein product [Vitrella brassicaformis CCMP3155]|eukprot:CEM11009.1 unnamed protein product [Vitrella brassicaformis CCMP3155]